MTAFIILLCAGLLTAISLLHLYWAFGGKWGTAAAIPEKPDGTGRTFNPGTPGTIVVACGLLLFAALLLVQSGYIASYKPDGISRMGCVAAGAIFLLRAVGDFRYVGLFKKVRGTVFAAYDTKLFSPLCLLLALSFALAVVKL